MLNGLSLIWGGGKGVYDRACPLIQIIFGNLRICPLITKIIPLSSPSKDEGRK
jgi:hypothetical protein